MEIGSVFTSFGISSSALTAQRKRLDYIANNLANVNTTRTAEGGPFKRQDIVFTEKAGDDVSSLRGVDFEEADLSDLKPKRVFDPSHPDAKEDGFVEFPDINVVNEMVNMIKATRAYDANIQVFTSSKAMMTKAFDILK